MGTSAEKLDYSLETKSLIKTEINRINNILTDASIFRNYPETLYSGYIDVLNNGTLTLWNNLKHVRNQGTSFTLYGTAEAPIKINIKGNSSQETSSNLLEINPNELVQTFYGVTVTYNDDGTFTLNGTSTNFFQLYFPYLNETASLLQLEANTYYYLNGCASGGSSNTYCLEVETESGYFQDTGNGVQIFNNSGTNTLVYLTVYRNQTFNNMLFKPMLIKGTEPKEFEPYGKPPSPTTPKVINIVKGNNSIYIDGHLYYMNLIGENVFDKDNTSSILNGWINNTNGEFKRNSSDITVVAKVKPNTQYQIKKMMCLPTTGNRFRLGTLSHYPKEDTFTVSNLVIADGETETIITTGAEDIYILAFIWTNKTTTTSEEAINSFEIRELHPVFEEFNNEDTFFKAQDGDLYYDSLNQTQKDLLNIDSWYMSKQTNKIILDGNETWYQGSSSITDVFYISLISDYATENNIPLCECFQGIDNVSGLSEMNTQENNTIAFIDNTDNLRFYVKTSDFTLSEFKTWLQNNNISIYYKLANPVFIELNDLTLIGELENIRNAKSALNRTQVSQTNTDLPFIVDIQAVGKF